MNKIKTVCTNSDSYMQQEKIIKTFFTDGACSGNPGPGGFGVVGLKHDKMASCSETGQLTFKDVIFIDYNYNEFCSQTTNNREELKAILHVFKIAAADPSHEYLVYSDSAYAVNMINSWIYNWAKNNWLNSKKQIVENLDLVKELYSYLNIDFFNCQVKKVSGHAGNVGNELADALATDSRTKIVKLIKDNDLVVNHLDFDFLNKI